MVHRGHAGRVCVVAAHGCALASVTGACQWIAGIEELSMTSDASVTGDGPTAPTDGARADGNVAEGPRDVDAGSALDSSRGDASLRHDASADGADTGPAPTYGVFTDLAQWETFDMAPVGGQAWGIGGAFDGRFVYYTPGQQKGTNLVRYDTTMPFPSTGSWGSFDVTSVAGGPYIYNGAAFDGRFVYLTPDLTEDALTSVGGVVRYDTTQSFASTGAWSVFDTTTLGHGAAGYQGAVFDGTYLYFAPCYGNTSTRFTVGAPFSATASWSTFVTTSIAPDAEGFRGGTFDGRFIYYAPFVGDRSAANAGTVTRYDTTAGGGFANGGAWSSFDISSLNTNAVGFAGAVFDGRHVMFVPKVGSIAARFDTQQSLSAAAAWEFLDLTTIDPAVVPFYGGAFDGRYVYLAPETIYTGGAKFEVLALRFDTTLPFSNLSSWEKFDVYSKNSGVTGFNGAVFDGAYVYFVPTGGTVTARFLARQPPGLPPFWSASFL
jgi:hypothetical protein